LTVGCRRGSYLTTDFGLLRATFHLRQLRACPHRLSTLPATPPDTAQLLCPPTCVAWHLGWAKLWGFLQQRIARSNGFMDDPARFYVIKLSYFMFCLETGDMGRWIPRQHARTALLPTGCAAALPFSLHLPATTSERRHSAIAVLFRTNRRRGHKTENGALG